MEEFSIKLKNIAYTPRKTRLVTALIRCRKIEDALVILEHTPRKGAKFLIKALKNAQACSRHNYKLDNKSLMIKEIFVTEGLKRKKLLNRRYKDRRVVVKNSRGASQAVLITKRKSHVTLIISGQKLKPPATKTKPSTKPVKITEKSQDKVKS